MHHPASASISSLDSISDDDATVCQSGCSSPDTPSSSAPQSSSSSVKSLSHAVEKRSSLKSSLKTSKSATSLAVRFSVPEPLPAMPRRQPNAPLSPPRSAKGSRQYPSNNSSDYSTGPPRASMQKRLSTPAPISRKPPSSLSNDSRTWSAPAPRKTSRVSSIQSFASAPAVLQATPSPSQPPSQYNPLEHHLPCLTPGCKNHYTDSLLGPTFYSPQQPYQLVRKRGLCPSHANKDLKLGNHKVKCTWESMRQNAGRKTLGLIAAEFEIFVQREREGRAIESERMHGWQRQRLLNSSLPSKNKQNVWGEDWDWRYSPRPCTKKGCGKQWYSPFDNKLYMFYTCTRPSGLVPLSTMCPACARADVESTEERIGARRREIGATTGPEWDEWLAQILKDREMEVEFWEQAQERVIQEKMGSAPMMIRPESEKGNAVKEKRKKKLDVCVVM